MKTWIKFELLGLFMLILTLWLGACTNKLKAEPKPEPQVVKIEEKPAKRILSEEFKKYWYAGDAEITSYKLVQARYGEYRDGTAMLIYVTEPFLKKVQVKADEHQADNIPVLKLNSTKNFLTGIYPYSIMTSSFYPVRDQGHALKVTFSMQEWCGHVYGQLNNRDKFEIEAHSYFESEGDQKLQFDKTTLENELWNQIRLEPKELPVGDLEIIPSFEYIRLVHIALKPYKASATLLVEGAVATYEIKYPELERTLKINFNASFPYEIQEWAETYKGGFGNNAEVMTTTGKKLKMIKSPYWTKGSNTFVTLRDTLGL